MRKKMSRQPRSAVGVSSVLLCILMVMSSGCVGFSKSAPPEVVQSIRRVTIVPIEPPPLTGGGVLDDIPSGDPLGVACGLLIGGIVYLIVQPEPVPDDAPPYVALSERIDQWYSSGDAWVPTVVLAHEAASHLSAVGDWEVAVREELCKPASLKKREATWHMENWFRPLRKWYNQKHSVLSADELQQLDADAVLEVGIINFGFHKDLFMFSVLTKLVTVPDGKVRARARSFVSRDVGDSRKLFDNEAQRFKQLVAVQGSALIAEDLDKMGLVPW